MSYIDYYNANGDKDCYYVVTTFGCNSTPSDLWIPQNAIFNDFRQAYEYFLKQSPFLDDKDNATVQCIPAFKPEYLHNGTLCIVIESRKQIAGYHTLSANHDSSVSYAKRPYGVVISRCIIAPH